MFLQRSSKHSNDFSDNSPLYVPPDDRRNSYFHAAAVSVSSGFNDDFFETSDFCVDKVQHHPVPRIGPEEPPEFSQPLDWEIATVTEEPIIFVPNLKRISDFNIVLYIMGYYIWCIESKVHAANPMRPPLPTLRLASKSTIKSAKCYALLLSGSVPFDICWLYLSSNSFFCDKNDKHSLCATSLKSIYALTRGGFIGSIFNMIGKCLIIVLSILWVLQQHEEAEELLRAAINLIVSPQPFTALDILRDTSKVEQTQNSEFYKFQVSSDEVSRTNPSKLSSCHVIVDGQQDPSFGFKDKYIENSSPLFELLQGRVPFKMRGSIIEVVGEAGIGKSHFCYSIAAYTLIEDLKPIDSSGNINVSNNVNKGKNKVVWIDTEQKFNPFRLEAAIYRQLKIRRLLFDYEDCDYDDFYYDEITVDCIKSVIADSLSRVEVIPAFTLDEVLDVLDDVVTTAVNTKHQLSVGAEHSLWLNCNNLDNETESTIPILPTIIIVDSIAAPFRLQSALIDLQNHPEFSEAFPKNFQLEESNDLKINNNNNSINNNNNESFIDGCFVDDEKVSHCLVNNANGNGELCESNYEEDEDGEDVNIVQKQNFISSVVEEETNEMIDKAFDDFQVFLDPFCSESVQKDFIISNLNLGKKYKRKNLSLAATLQQIGTALKKSTINKVKYTKGTETAAIGEQEIKGIIEKWRNAEMQQNLNHLTHPLNQAAATIIVTNQITTVIDNKTTSSSLPADHFDYYEPDLQLNCTTFDSDDFKSSLNSEFINNTKFLCRSKTSFVQPALGVDWFHMVHNRVLLSYAVECPKANNNRNSIVARDSPLFECRLTKSNQYSTSNEGSRYEIVEGGFKCLEE